MPQVNAWGPYLKQLLVLLDQNLNPWQKKVRYASHSICCCCVYGLARQIDIRVSHSYTVAGAKIYHSSPNVRESRAVLDSGFHAVDSRFHGVDSGLCQWNVDSGLQSLVRFRIPWAVFQIPQLESNEFPDSVFHKQKFPSFRNPDSIKWGDVAVSGVSHRFNFSCSALLLREVEVGGGYHHMKETMQGWQSEIKQPNLSLAQVLFDP